MSNPIIVQILVQVFLIGLNAVFACGEIAVISMNDNKLAQLAAAGDKRAVKLARLTSQPARFLATIQVAITLSGFLGSAFAADNFSDSLVNLFLALGIQAPLATLDTIAVVLITLILSYFTLVFGELVPKRLAMKKAESLALGMASLISAIAKLFSPIVTGLTYSTNFILKLCGVDPESEEDEVSEEEIRMMVDIGNQRGVIDTLEKEMIQKVFEFDDLRVGDFATHRTKASILWLEDELEDWEKTMDEDRHTTYLMCGETVDHVMGTVNIVDYYRLKDKTKENVLKSVVKEACFVLESLFADQLFAQMKHRRKNFAVVVDEYGGTVGIVTLRDLLEQIVGDLGEQEGEEGILLEDLGKGRWRIGGSVTVEEFAEAIGVSLPEGEYDTFGGFVMNQLGYIPADGSSCSFVHENMEILVTNVVNHHVKSAEVQVNAKQDAGLDSILLYPNRKQL